MWRRRSLRRAGGRDKSCQAQPLPDEEPTQTQVSWQMFCLHGAFFGTARSLLLSPFPQPTTTFVCTSPHKRLFSPLVCFVSFFIVFPHPDARSWPNHFFHSVTAPLQALHFLCRSLFLAFSLSLLLHSPYTPFILVIQLNQPNELKQSILGVLYKYFLNFSFIPFAFFFFFFFTYTHDSHVITKTPPR